MTAFVARSFWTWRTAAVWYTCIESDALDITAHINVLLDDCSLFLQGEHKSFRNDDKTSTMSGGVYCVQLQLSCQKKKSALLFFNYDKMEMQGFHLLY